MKYNIGFYSKARSHTPLYKFGPPILTPITKLVDSTTTITETSNDDVHLYINQNYFTVKLRDKRNWQKRKFVSEKTWLIASPTGSTVELAMVLSGNVCDGDGVASSSPTLSSCLLGIDQFNNYIDRKYSTTNGDIDWYHGKAKPPVKLLLNNSNYIIEEMHLAPDNLIIFLYYTWENLLSCHDY